LVFALKSDIHVLEARALSILRKKNNHFGRHKLSGFHYMCTFPVEEPRLKFVEWGLFD